MTTNTPTDIDRQELEREKDSRQRAPFAKDVVDALETLSQQQTEIHETLNSSYKALRSIRSNLSFIVVMIILSIILTTCSALLFL